MSTRALLLVILVATMLAPGASGGENQFQATIAGQGNAIANCQLAIVIGSVLLLGMEDGLGLATLPSQAPPRLALPPSQGSAANATCETVVDELRIHGAQRHGAQTFVSGPQLVGTSDGVGTRGIVIPLPYGNTVAVCQKTFYVDSLVLGGTAFGLSPGWNREPVRVTFVASPEATAQCRVDVLAIKFIGPAA